MKLEKLPIFFFIRNKLLFGALISLSFLSACGTSNTKVIPNICSVLDSPCLQGKAALRVITDKGEMILELDGDAAPVTAGNFIDLVVNGAYDGTVFHRVVREPVPFVLQGGDPFSNDPNTPERQYGKGSFIDPKTGRPRFIPLEIKLKTEVQPRYGRLTTDPNELSQLQLRHQKGSLAMARSQSLDSGSAQFYIALRALPELDGRFAVFGQVIKGFEVIDLIKEGDRILKIRFLEGKKL